MIISWPQYLTAERAARAAGLDYLHALTRGRNLHACGGPGEITRLAVGKHCDGAGLWLHKRPDGGAQWVLRVTVHGRRREMGLGSLSDVPLKRARELADHWRKLAASGIDPIKERRREARGL